MEDLKTKVKRLVPEDKHFEIDKIFHEWLTSLKVNTILDQEKNRESNKGDKGARRKKSRGELPEKIPLKIEIEELKKQIESFKEKMKIYKESHTSDPNSALADVKEEICKVREGILKLKVKFAKTDDGRKSAENAELVEKLDEVKQFLERLK